MFPLSFLFIFFTLNKKFKVRLPGIQGILEKMAMSLYISGIRDARDLEYKLVEDVVASGPYQLTFTEIEAKRLERGNISDEEHFGSVPRSNFIFSANQEADSEILSYIFKYIY